MFNKKNLGFFLVVVLIFFVVPLSKDRAHAYVCVKKDNTAGCRDLNVKSAQEANCNVQTEVMVTGKCGNVVSNQGWFSCVDISDDINKGFCRDISVMTTFEGAKISCGVGNTPIYRQCPENPEPVVTKQYYGCIKPDDGGCVNVLAIDKDDATKQCLANYTNKARLQNSACLPAKSYPCFINRTGGCKQITANTLESAKKQCTDVCELEPKTQCELEADFNKKCSDELGPLAGTSARSLKNLAAEQLNPGNISSPANLISRAINLMTAFIGSIALLLYVVAGFMWMTASGASEQVDKAKKIMVWTTLGVVVMLASYMLTSTLFSFIPK